MHGRCNKKCLTMFDLVPSKSTSSWVETIGSRVIEHQQQHQSMLIAIEQHH